MFEKEAEEKARDIYNNFFGDIVAYPEILKAICVGVLKGAEFGYNKANEWHYPSKGEYPKDEKDLLMSKQLNLLIKMNGSDCLSLALGQYNFSTQQFVYQHIVGLTDVIAWKEIVLPELKEIKEND